MPRPPNGLFNQINYVIRFWMDPCDAPWTIYVETALPALLEALASYFIIDRKQMLEAQLRPSGALAKRRAQKKGRRGSKAGRWGRLGRIASAASFDPNERLGKKNFPGFNRLGRPQWSTGTLHVWALYGVLQRILFWWMVADIVFNFWLNWTSSLYETEYCQELERAILQARGSGQLIGSIANWNAVLILDVEKQRGGIAVTPGGFNVGEGSFTVIAETLFEAVPFADAIDLAIFDSASYPDGQPLIIASGSTASNQEMRLTVGGAITGPGTFYIAARTTGGLRLISDKFLMVAGV